MQGALAAFLSCDRLAGFSDRSLHGADGGWSVWGSDLEWRGPGSAAPAVGRPALLLHMSQGQSSPAVSASVPQCCPPLGLFLSMRTCCFYSIIFKNALVQHAR